MCPENFERGASGTLTAVAQRATLRLLQAPAHELRRGALHGDENVQNLDGVMFLCYPSLSERAHSTSWFGIARYQVTAAVLLVDSLCRAHAAAGELQAESTK